ncbi:MAG TPA: alpha/beta hydrolase [Vicinamibacterales bacterium]|jgi:pimeloyl-ACP methyl ester carboxylesterase
MPTDGFVATRDGLRLYYRTVGTGPRLVLLPNGIYFVDDLASLGDICTLVAYDVRNRGRSDAEHDDARLRRAIEQDVDDLDDLRTHFDADPIMLIGHSYIGVVVALYAMRYGAHVDRVVQIGPSPPSSTKVYPPQATGEDGVLKSVLAQMTELEPQRHSLPPEEFCRKFWTVLRPLYVADPANADKIHWERCDVPNELGFMRYFTTFIIPSLQRLNLSAADFASVRASVLTIHGTRDRSAPYGGGRDWVRPLPNARLLTVPNTAHAPWLESPALVLGALRTFLLGAWPDSAEVVGPE